jgi:hypothetical protein
MNDPRSQPQGNDLFGSRPGDDALSVYDNDLPTVTAGSDSAAVGAGAGSATAEAGAPVAPAASAAANTGTNAGPSASEPSRQSQSENTALPADAQDNYFERREPAELFFCIILAAANAGLARFIWEPLLLSKQWVTVIGVEGCFITLSLLSLALGLRPYLTPSSLQISTHGIKYRGPHWPQRKTINWGQIFKLYLSPDVLIVLYRPLHNPKGMRLLLIQCNYLSDRDQILVRFSKYAPVAPIYLKNPDWYLKAIFLVGYMSLVCWILYMLRG